MTNPKIQKMMDDLIEKTKEYRRLQKERLNSIKNPVMRQGVIDSLKEE
jgi:SAM-dependent MidA family methyltransferase